jgi:hypothetical protein
MVCVVPGTGLEPAHLAAPDPKSGVSANSTTRALRSVVRNLSAIDSTKLSMAKNELFIGDQFFIVWSAH